MLPATDPIRSSVLLPALRAAKRPTFRVRKLTREEINQLENHGCQSQDWSLVHVAEAFRTGRCRDVSFRGRVVLGKFYGTVDIEGTREPAGLERVTLEDCWIEDGVVIRDTDLIVNMRIGHGAAIVGSGRIVHHLGANFGVGAQIPMVETGGRVTRSFPEMSIIDAGVALRPGGNLRGLAAYLRRIDAYAASAASAYGVIQAGARILHTPRIENSFVGAHAVINAAQRVSDSVVLSDRKHPALIEDGSIVVESAVQWGCEVRSLSVVERSVLCEYSRVERHAKVIQSIIGPNSTIAEGEVTSSLIGPFVGFHHQALLIGVVWPEGKGNIGYGCNCGSNHTGKAPDQEFWPGEGLFLGLGVNVKYPGCFVEAPYTVVATGTTLPPQRVSFPFSLILEPAAPPEGLDRGLNEIIPAWVLGQNLFAVLRNERKFRARDQSFRTPMEHRIIRAETVQRMLESRAVLMSVSGHNHYTEDGVMGLGKNFMTEVSRLRAIEIYTFHIQLFALEGLFNRFRSLRRLSPSVLFRSSRDPEWELQRTLIQCEGLGKNPHDLVRLYLEKLRTLARCVEDSKARDDTRGMRIIPDYADHHNLASENPFVREVWAEVDRIVEEAEDLLEQ